MYSEKHRIFLQKMFNCGYLDTSEVLNFCRNIEAEDVEDFETLKTFVSHINREIIDHGFRITFGVCETFGTHQTFLINTISDDMNKTNLFNVTEMDLFRTILEKVITSPRKRLSSICSVNLTNNLVNNLSRSDGEKLINEWSKQGYLVLKDGYVYLGMRCIVEFEPLFVSTWSEYINTCNLCSKLILTGKKCASCEKVMHTYCVDTFLSKYNKCPECKTIWKDFYDNESESSMETSAEDTDDRVTPKPKRNKSQRH